MTLAELFQAVSDNYSRRILAWRVLDHLEPGITARLFLDASQAMTEGKPTVFVDGGRENYNAAVDEVIESGLLKRVLVDLAPNSVPVGMRAQRDWKLHSDSQTLPG